MKVKVLLAVAAIAVAIGGVLMFGFMNKRPQSLSIGIHPHPSAIIALRAVVNGAPVVDSSFQGRSQTGGLNYQSNSGADLSVVLMWYDRVADRYFQKDFTLDTRDFSTFDKGGDRAAVRIEVGPGADVLVTTPHPEGLLLVGQNRMDDITPEMDEDVVLAEYCGTQVAKDPSEGGILMRVVGDDNALARAKEQQANWLARNPAPKPRCAEGGRQ